jgi:hypothetical protein
MIKRDLQNKFYYYKKILNSTLTNGLVAIKVTILSKNTTQILQDLQLDHKFNKK